MKLIASNKACEWYDGLSAWRQCGIMLRGVLFAGVILPIMALDVYVAVCHEVEMEKRK